MENASRWRLRVTGPAGSTSMLLAARLRESFAAAITILAAASSTLAAGVSITPAATKCMVDGNCRSGFYCNANHACALKQRVGALCRSPSECETSNCQSGRCIGGKGSAPATYSIGTLRMTGRASAPATYSIGTLQMTGQASTPATYSIGTLQMTGQASTPATYSIGTLQMTGENAH
jgi:hypothetical protein